jgi:hypothetical protein
MAGRPLAEKTALASAALCDYDQNDGDAAALFRLTIIANAGG